ncbi:MAG TPA: MBL fold metallo-hydrolase, partial [Sulfuricurvum sp.]|nr:MBL fold metallo-hydrolase [Sulfuricurvum sp.]
TQHQLMRSSLSLGKLTTIFITHLHGDHIYGLPGLLASKTLNKALRPLTLYGPPGIKAFIECSTGSAHSELAYPFEIVEFAPGDTFAFDRFTVSVRPLVHSIESFAFDIKEHDTAGRLDEAKLRSEGLEPSPLYGELKRGRGVVFEGRRFEPGDYLLEPRKGRRVVIAGDNAEPEVLAEALDDLDLLVHESTYTQPVFDALEKKHQHTTALQLGKSAQRHGVKNLIATHISARYGQSGAHSIEEIYNEIAAVYKGRVFIANDFDCFELRRDGTLVKG